MFRLANLCGVALGLGVALVLVILLNVARTYWIAPEGHRVVLQAATPAGDAPRALTAADFEWCQQRELPPYAAPAGWQSKPVLQLRLQEGSGACSALIGVLIGAAYAEVKGHAYWIDESSTRLKGNHSYWFRRFFQPRGLEARRGNATKDATFADEVTTLTRMPYIEVGGGARLPRTRALRHWLRRVWAFQPWVQQRVCPALAALNLHWPYIGLMVRRGDKNTKEKRPDVPIEQLKDTMEGLSLGLTREVFVGSDDCRVLAELRAAMPDWTFRSLCHLYDARGWFLESDTKSDLDAHFIKFFGEMMALAASAIYIGDGWSNVQNWVTYMRPGNSSNATFIDMRKYPFYDLARRL